MLDNIKKGKSRPPEKILPQDYLDNPIWVWALDEEGVNGQDETWQKPLLGPTDVTYEMVAVIIGLYVKGTSLIANGVYNTGFLTGFQTVDQNTPKDILNQIFIWYNGEWQDPSCVPGIKEPITLVAIPTIYGEQNVEFVLKSSDAFEAKRILKKQI